METMKILETLEIIGASGKRGNYYLLVTTPIQLCSTTTLEDLGDSRHHQPRETVTPIQLCSTTTQKILETLEITGAGGKRGNYSSKIRESWRR